MRDGIIVIRINIASANIANRRLQQQQQQQQGIIFVIPSTIPSAPLCRAGSSSAGTEIPIVLQCASVTATATSRAMPAVQPQL